MQRRAGEPRTRTSAHPVTVELIKLIEHQIHQALRDADLATLDRAWAEEYTFTTPSGQLVPKAEYLAGLQAQAFVYDTLEIEGLSVRTYDETAIATGRARVKARLGREEAHGIDHYQTVYVWQDARWQAVSTLATRVVSHADPGARRHDDAAVAAGSAPASRIAGVPGAGGSGAAVAAATTTSTAAPAGACALVAGGAPGAVLLRRIAGGRL